MDALYICKVNRRFFNHPSENHFTCAAVWPEAGSCRRLVLMDLSIIKAADPTLHDPFIESCMCGTLLERHKPSLWLGFHFR
jgi:hypothetical protein